MDVPYVEALAAPFTVNTMPEGTLNALADHRAMLTQNGSRGQRLIAGVNLITSGIAITMVALAGRVIERAIR